MAVHFTGTAAFETGAQKDIKIRTVRCFRIPESQQKAEQKAIKIEKGGFRLPLWNLVTVSAPPIDKNQAIKPPDFCREGLQGDETIEESKNSINSFVTFEV
ncbi:MAG: hypothetical protein KF865_13500 [Bdellovibrionaceae bacterium]|nr:hypothetical protein [Pseudobdellovibrionaceae bacterium]